MYGSIEWAIAEQGFKLILWAALAIGSGALAVMLGIALRLVLRTQDLSIYAPATKRKAPMPGAQQKK